MARSAERLTDAGNISGIRTSVLRIASNDDRVGPESADDSEDKVPDVD